MSKFSFGSTASLSLLTAVSLPALAFAQSSQSQFESFEDEIIVTGSPLVRSLDDAITGVSVLSGDDLERNLASTIGETLKSEPGVSSTFFGAGASRPIIRGQGGDRVRVLTNGIGSIDASSASPDHAVAVDPAQAERIEVLRGAGILRYGSSGAGGIVNVIDGRFASEIPEDTQAALRMSATTVDQGFEAAASVDQPLTSNLVLHLNGTYRNANDYDIPGFAESAALRALEEAEEEGHDDDDHDEEEREEEEEAFGTLPNSFSESRSGTAALTWIGANGSFGIAINQNEAEYGIPGGHGHGHEEEHDHEDGEEDHDEEEEEEEGDVFIELEQTRLDLNASLNMDGVFERLQFFGGYADYTHTEFEGPGEVGTVFANEGYEGRLELVQRQKGAWSAAHGLQIRNRDFSAIGEEAFVPPSETQQYAVYTFHEYDTDAWHLEGAGRIEVTDQENTVTNQNIDFTALSLSAGADVHLSDAVRLGGTVFRTERAPTTEELFSNGPHLATDAFELGDATLGKETATGAELAFRHREAGHALTVNLFYTSYDDYIFETETGAEQDELPVFQFIADDAEFYGFEAQGRMDLFETDRWSVTSDALVEYVRAKTDSGNLPRIPPLAILAGLEARQQSWSLRAEVDWADSQDRTAQFELPTDSFTLVNLSTRYDFGDDISFALAVDNVLDDDARQHTSFLKDDLPLPGRNFRFTVSAKI